MSHTTEQQTGADARPVKGAGLAVTALVLGLVALLLAFIPIINNFAFFLALVGLVFGVIGWVGGRRRKRTGKGMAMAGTILCVLSIVGVLASQAFYSSVLDDAAKSLDTSSGVDKAHPPRQDAQVVHCGGNDQFGIAKMSVKVTNHSSKSSTYDVAVVLDSQDGTTQRDSGDFFVDDLGHGQSRVLEDAGFTENYHAGDVCKIKSVDRYATNP